jgi:uncharacterized protein with GYD domain
MPKYLLKASLSVEGVRGILEEGGTRRVEVASRLAESVDGTVEALYFAFGGTDAYLIVDVPSNEAAAALALNVSATGAMAVETVVLITPEELDSAVGMDVVFRPPGG